LYPNSRVTIDLEQLHLVCSLPFEEDFSKVVIFQRQFESMIPHQISGQESATQPTVQSAIQDEWIVLWPEKEETLKQLDEIKEENQKSF
jgi:hypothetical protein